MTIFELSDRDFQKFRELVYNEAGINLTEVKKALLQARLSKRLRLLGIASYSEYYDYINDNSDTEMSEFVNALTTNKTDFFRENKHFIYMKEELLPELEHEKEIRIWSAGCSTGEEPYSISMTMLDYFENRSKIPFKILATDIDTQVLDKGRAGIYKAEGVDEIDLDVRKKYFYRGKDENAGKYKIKEIVQKPVFFRRLNLKDAAYPFKKKFHIVFCRNVIIYFDKDTQRFLFNNIYRYIEDGGYLFIGHSENITGLTDQFKLVGATIYKKV